MLKVKSAILIVLAGLAVTSASADLIPISVQNGGIYNGLSGTITVFTSPTLANTFSVSGTLTNNGSGTVVMNSADNFGSLIVTSAGDPGNVYFGFPDTSPFMPPDVPADGVPVDVDLFTFTVAAGTPVGSYNGWTYDVFDAESANVGSGLLDVIVQAQVPQVPEPAPAFLMAMALSVVVFYQRRVRTAKSDPPPSATLYSLN